MILAPSKEGLGHQPLLRPHKIGPWSEKVKVTHGQTRIRRRLLFLHPTFRGPRRRDRMSKRTLPQIAGEPEEDPVDPSGEGGIPLADAEIVRGPRPKGTVEEAQSREHMMTHLPKNPSVRSAQQQRSNERRSGKRRRKLSRTARRKTLNLANRLQETISPKTRAASKRNTRIFLSTR